jgi:hypothetical protein
VKLKDEADARHGELGKRIREADKLFDSVGKSASRTREALKSAHKFGNDVAKEIAMQVTDKVTTYIAAKFALPAPQGVLAPGARFELEDDDPVRIRIREAADVNELNEVSESCRQKVLAEGISSKYCDDMVRMLKVLLNDGTVKEEYFTHSRVSGLLAKATTF